jgi:group I intron endonuclease
MATLGVYNYDPTLGSLFLTAFSRDQVKRMDRATLVTVLRQTHAACAKAADGKCVVYVAVNKTNNKMYVGVTKRRLKTRIVAHFYCAFSGKRNGLFPRAIRECGKDAFEFLIAAVCSSFEQGLLSEQEAIACIKPEYNLTSGGEGNLGWKPSEETKKRIAASRTGKPGPWTNGIPEDLRAKMIAGQRAMVDPGAVLRGRKRPPEVVEKIAAKRRGKSLPSSTPELRAIRVANMIAASQRKSIAIECLDDGKAFETIKAAALHYGINKSYLQRVVKGELKTNVACGLRFQEIRP